MEPTIFKPRLKFKPPLKFFKFGHRSHVFKEVGEGNVKVRGYLIKGCGRVYLWTLIQPSPGGTLSSDGQGGRVFECALAVWVLQPWGLSDLFPDIPDVIV